MCRPDDYIHDDAERGNAMNTSEVTEAYDRWLGAIADKRDHHTCSRFWESYIAIRDASGVCGHEDPFGGPCILPVGHQPARRHDDGRSTH